MRPITVPIRTIARDELHEKLARGDRFKLVMSLGEWEFRMKRIPGSIRFASDDEMLATLQRDEEIVVYCTNPACHASAEAYQTLVEHGYTNVRRYAGGVSEWDESGLPLDGERGRPA
jgi:rhodanese-related sulfurtransferase